MKITIIDCGSSKVNDIVHRVRDLGIRPKVIDFLVVNPGPCDGIIISGAPILLTEKDHADYLEYFSFISQLDIPVLGICFGHQMIGLHYGAKISRCKEDRDWQNINIIESSDLSEGFESSMKFREDHCECINLPEGFHLLGSSVTCEVEMMRHNSRDIYGVQFHPEVSDGNGVKLFRNFINICKNN